MSHVVDYENIKKYSMVECAHCAYMFCNKRILKRHLYSVHNESKNTPGFVLKRLEKFTDIQCLEKGCRCKFHSKILFISHLKFDHYMDFDVQCLKFPSENEFLWWKVNFEEENKCHYVQITGCKTIRHEKKVSYYYCNRSTYFGSKSKGLKKRTNPIKVKGPCTSTIKEIQNNDGSVEILLCATHYGHDITSEHVPIVKRQQEEIDELVQQGDRPDIVINAARAKASDSLGRVCMLNRKAIKNIERKRRIIRPSVKKQRTIHGLSTERWILKLQRTPDNPIVFYKPKKLACENFEPDDLILIFMTQNQQYWINKYGTDGIFMVTEMRMICAGLYLTVLYVCDEFNVMLPVCFMMCNSSKIYQSFFLNSIFNKIGGIYAKALIIDDNYDLYENWCSIMSPVKYVINPRYIDNQIINKLQIDVEDQDLQHEIYDKICSFFNASGENTKEEITNYVKTHLKTNCKTKIFGIFFDHMFASRADKWAFCYLKESLDLNKMIDINTVYNQILVLCENKKNFTQNLSKNIHIFSTVLLEIEKNRKTKIEEVNITISNNHKNALCCHSIYIFPITSNTWIIRIEDSTNNFVRVTRKSCKIIDCEVKCQACHDICIHVYECSCSKGKINICEHIHALGIFNERIQNNIDDQVNEDELESRGLKAKISSKLNRIVSNVHCVNDKETLERISVSLREIENNIFKIKTTGDSYDD